MFCPAFSCSRTPQACTDAVHYAESPHVRGPVGWAGAAQILHRNERSSPECEQSSESFWSAVHSQPATHAPGMLLSPQDAYCALSYAERFLLILYLPPVALPSGALLLPLASVAARGFSCTGSTTSGFASDELFTAMAPVPCVVLSRTPPPRAEGAAPLGTGGVLGSLFV